MRGPVNALAEYSEGFQDHQNVRKPVKLLSGPQECLDLGVDPGPDHAHNAFVDICMVSMRWKAGKSCETSTNR